MLKLWARMIRQQLIHGREPIAKVIIITRGAGRGARGAAAEAKIA